MNSHLLVSIRITLVLLVVTCAIYPAVVWGIGQVAFRDEANGSLVMHEGKVVGSSLIGQTFNGDQYFHPRPSAAGNGYDASASSGSNLGPTSKKLRDRIAEARAAGTPAVADALTTSGSGLDPHISPEYARLQIERVARARGIPAADVEQLVAARTEGRFLGVYGEPRVNVLLLNLDLDKRQSAHRASIR